jgi:hypothetical protein
VVVCVRAHVIDWCDVAAFCRVCRLIQEFEREARTDGMPTRELVDRKRQLVGQFNTYVNLKKQHASTEAGRGELLAGAAPVDGQAAAATSNPYDGARS